LAEEPTLPRLILASGSPRRRELLRGLGLGFTVRPVAVDETRTPDEDPREYVLRLAREKAAYRQSPGELILAADTIVVLDGEVLGKPVDDRQARRMLASIAGRRHVVLTGVAALDADTGRLVSDLERSEVEIAPLTDEWIAWYVATGEPMDKAGSYAIQDLGALFVESVTGNYTNVVGLPLPLTGRLVGELGWDLREFRDA
jgi:septum formation protein